MTRGNTHTISITRFHSNFNLRQVQVRFLAKRRRGQKIGRCPTSYHRAHAEKVIQVIGGDPVLVEVAANEVTILRSGLG